MCLFCEFCLFLSFCYYEEKYLVYRNVIGFEREGKVDICIGEVEFLCSSYVENYFYRRFGICFRKKGYSNYDIWGEVV